MADASAAPTGGVTARGVSGKHPDVTRIRVSGMSEKMMTHLEEEL
jgi:hypothetical protein